MPRPIIAAVDPRGDDASPAALGAVLARLMGAPLIVAGAYPFDRAVDDLYPEYARTLRLDAERALRRASGAVAVIAAAGSTARAPRDGRLVAAGAVVALPVLTGPAIPGLPADADGFLPADAHGVVRGCADVFAAGDATDFPVKHGGLAAQQADAVAETIAARVGTIAWPEPFRPLVRALLLTGGDPLYLSGELPAPAEVSEQPLWSPPTKIAGRYLAGFLE